METGENNSFCIKSNKFSSSLFKQYHLTIDISLCRFSYCILDTESLTYEYLKSYSIESNDINQISEQIISQITKDEILKLEFSSQIISFSGFPNTLIPNDFFNEEQNKEMLEFNADVYEHILNDDVPIHDLKIIYSIPEKIMDICKSFFSTAKYISQNAVLIKQYSLSKISTDSAYIYIDTSNINITIFSKNKLLFHNTFTYKEKEDMLYFVLFCFEQLNISTENINATIYGNIKEDDERYKLLYDYIKNITLGKRSDYFKFPKEFKEIQQEFYSLFTSILCA